MVKRYRGLIGPQVGPVGEKAAGGGKDTKVVSE